MQSELDYIGFLLTLLPILPFYCHVIDITWLTVKSLMSFLLNSLYIDIKRASLRLDYYSDIFKFVLSVI